MKVSIIIYQYNIDWELFSSFILLCNFLELVSLYDLEEQAIKIFVARKS